VKRSPVRNVVLDPVRESLISSSGAVLVREVIAVADLDRGLSGALAPWRAARAVHDPGKVLLDVAVAVALGGDCLADLAAVRAQPAVFGPVASDPTVSRLFAALAGDVDAVVAAIRQVRARARAKVWAQRRPLPGTPGRRTGGQVIVDIDATLVTAHSEKENAEPTHKRGFGFAPMCAFVDHGEHGTGETLAVDLRPGNASPWNSADHISIIDTALGQLPEGERSQLLVRADTGASSKAFLHHITDAGLEYSPRGGTPRSGSPPMRPSRPRSTRFPSRRGGQRWTATGNPATAPRSPNSPPGCRPRPNRPGRRHGSVPSTGPQECG
jgi:hypothetical protein